MTVQSDGSKPRRFTTDDIPTKDRMAILHDVVGRANLRLELEPLDGAPVKVGLEWQQWDAALLTLADTNAIRLTRTPELISDGDGDFRLLRPTGAPFHFTCHGEEADGGAGDAILVFNGAPSTVRFLAPCQITSLRLSHTSLAAAARGLDERAIRSIAATPALRLLLAYTEIVRRQGSSGDPVLDHRVAQHMIDLLALAVGPTDDTREQAARSALPAARLATIRADVLANLSEVRLSARTVANRHGLSDRYVHMLFEETGQTFSRFVEDERLKRAYALLTDPSRPDMRIGEIAIAVGFSEHSTFNRAFRRRFGESPGRVRTRLNGRDPPG